MVTDRRGQVLLVGSVILAVTLISIVVLLNGVVYTEHVGGGTQDAYDDAKRVEHSMTRDLDSMIASIETDTGASDSNLDPNTDSVDSQYATMLGASRAATIDVEYLEDQSTTTITHDATAGKNFVPDNSPPVPASWDVVSSGEASQVNAFTMTVETSSLSPAAPFTVRVGSTWTLRMKTAGPNYEVVPTAGSACSEPLSGVTTITIDFVSGEIRENGTPTAVCTFSSPISGTASIAFEQPVSGDPYPTGSYEIELQGVADLYSRPAYNPAHDPTVPSNSPHVWRTAAFRFVYETPDVTYQNTLEVGVDDS